MKSDHKATSISNYQAMFTPCYHQDAFRIAIRSYDQDGSGYFLLVDPANFVTSIVLKGDIQHRKQTVGPDEIWVLHPKCYQKYTLWDGAG